MQLRPLVPGEIPGAQDMLSQTLNNFVAPNVNRYALYAAVEIARSAGPAVGTTRPSLFVGPSGSGKTHLLHAIELHAHWRVASCVVGYLRVPPTCVSQRA
jgi:chromosomal replication initiation ATPase DnaA